MLTLKAGTYCEHRGVHNVSTGCSHFSRLCSTKTLVVDTRQCCKHNSTCGPSNMCI